MSSVTAQILFGSSHPNHGGISPSYMLELHENSKPVWVLMEHPDKIYRDRRNNRECKFEPVFWIPTRYEMLEDALLMIGIYVLRDRSLISMFNKIFPDRKEQILLYTADSEALKEMRTRCRDMEYHYKVVISVLEGSTIRRQLKALEEYKMDVEVAMPVFSRHFSNWSKDTVLKGEIP